MKARLALAALGVVAVTALFGLAIVLRRDTHERNFEMLPADMVRSPALKSNGTTTAFADGLVQQAPPEGTIARGTTPLEYGPSLEEAKRAGEELANPFADTPQVLERGSFVFTNVCAGCHGSSGLGDAPIAKRGFPPPPSFLRAESRALKDGEMFHAVTFGRKNMPPAATIVERDDRWKAIRFIRSLQEAAQEPKGDAKGDTKGDVKGDGKGAEKGGGK